MGGIVLVRDLDTALARDDLAARVTRYDTSMARAATEDD